MKDIIILYHASCPDGLGGAYAAWKKFGDTADYFPVYHNDPPPSGLSGKTIHIIDFSYPRDTLLALEESAARLVVLDHHEGAQDAVKAVREHVYDETHSGTGIAWAYFHPDTPIPRLLAHIEDSDLWRFSLPDTKTVASYISGQTFDNLEAFDTLVASAETDDGWRELLAWGAVYGAYFDHLCETFAKDAVEVEFDGYRILAVNAPRLFRSKLGHTLAARHGPFSIVWYINNGAWHFSLRGDGTLDLTEIAKRHGGNGHPNKAAFVLPLDAPLPFVHIHSET